MKTLVNRLAIQSLPSRVVCTNQTAYADIRRLVDGELATLPQAAWDLIPEQSEDEYDDYIDDIERDSNYADYYIVVQI